MAWAMWATGAHAQNVGPSFVIDRSAEPTGEATPTSGTREPPRASQARVAFLQAEQLSRRTNDPAAVALAFAAVARAFDDTEHGVLAEAQAAVWRRRAENNATRVMDEWWSRAGLASAAGASDTVAYVAGVRLLEWRAAEPKATELPPALSAVLVRAMQGATAGSPAPRDAEFVFAIVHAERNQIASSARSFLQAVEMDRPFWPAANNGAAAFLALGNPAKAAELMALAGLYGPIEGDWGMFLLDNLEEFLQLVPAEVLADPQVISVRLSWEKRMQHFAPLRAREGLIRWGVVWLPKEQVAERREAWIKHQAEVESLIARRNVAISDFNLASERLDDVYDDLQFLPGHAIVRQPRTVDSRGWSRGTLLGHRRNAIRQLDNESDAIREFDARLAWLQRNSPGPVYRGRLATIAASVLDQVPPVIPREDAIIPKP